MTDPVEGAYYVGALRQNLINAHFCLVGAMMGHGEIVAFQLGHEDRGLGPKSAWNVSDPCVVVSVVLLEHIDKLGSSNIDTLTFRIVNHIVAMECGVLTSEMV